MKEFLKEGDVQKLLDMREKGRQQRMEGGKFDVAFDGTEDRVSVTQKLNGMDSVKFDLQCQIDACGGKWRFWGLYTVDKDGNPMERVKAKRIRGRYGPCWVVPEEEVDRWGRQFIPASKPRKDGSRGPGKVQKELGLAEFPEMDHAVARVINTENGGRLAKAVVQRVGNIHGQDATLILEGDDDE